MRAFHVTLLTAIFLLGCSRSNPNYSAVAGDCKDEVNDYCDIGGRIGDTGLTNTCVPAPSDDSCNEVEQGKCDDDEKCLIAAAEQSDNTCVDCLADGDCPLIGASCSNDNKCRAAPGARVQDDLIALYTFDTAVADEIADVSGFGTPLDLAVVGEGDYEVTTEGWLLNGDTLISSKEPAKKIFDEVSNTNAFSIEAWIRPASTDQIGPARIVSMSESPSAYNVSLGQGGSSGDQYAVRVRTATTDDDPPSIVTVESVVETEWTHLVFTRAANETVTLYVDGQAEVLTENGNTPNTPGALDNWDSTYTLNLGDEVQSNPGSRSWYGEYALVAIYRRDLDAGEVTQNFLAGR
jgi:hypothetical protein